MIKWPLKTNITYILLFNLLFCIGTFHYVKYKDSSNGRNLTATAAAANTDDASDYYGRPPSSRKTPEDIRYAAFGTSITWGLGLRLVDDRRHLTYPKLLSPDADNFAMRVTGPNVPAACTESFVGDDNHYDVIMLEFYDDMRHALYTLTRRLRERFPDAIIIILRLWLPTDIVNQDGVDVKSWAKRRGFDTSPSQRPLIRAAFLESGDKWMWSTDRRKKTNDLNFIAQKFGAHVMELDKPNDPRDWVEYYRYVTTDYLHWSDIGHADVARKVSHLVQRLGVPATPRKGEWTSRDFCRSIGDEGDVVGIAGGMTTSPNWVLNEGDEGYALELRTKVASVTVTNPSERPMLLYVSYFIKNHFPVKSMNRCKVTVKFEKGDDLEPVILDRVGANHHYCRHYDECHVMKRIGLIPPGVSIVVFERSGGDYFRLVSIVVTNENYMHSSEEFADGDRPPIEKGT